MQRAAASAPPSTPQSQLSSPDNAPSKRQKVSAALSPTVTPLYDLGPIQVTLIEEEEKREKDIERLAEEAGETKWVLSTLDGEEQNGVGGLRVALAGYADIDEEAWRPAMLGRKSFGKFNRKLEVKHATLLISRTTIIVMIPSATFLADRCITCLESSR